MATELKVAGIGVSSDVVATIVRLAAERVDGVAAVGGNDITSGLISVFTRHPEPREAAVTCEAEGDRLHVGVRIAAFYGYPFLALAAEVREAVAAAVRSQVGVDVSAVDVYIDSLVFPKE